MANELYTNFAYVFYAIGQTAALPPGEHKNGKNMNLLIQNLCLKISDDKLREEGLR